MLVYGVAICSRSLVITPIVFAVLSVMTVLYGWLEGILPVILIGCTYQMLLLLGILAVIIRDRLKQIGERFSDWIAYGLYFQTASSNAGRTSPDFPCKAKSTFFVRGVDSALISITTAPRLRAAYASEAAGCTVPEVPIEKKT